MGAVDTTYTFTATDTITSSKMNNIIDQTTITTDAIIGTTLEVASGKLKVRSQGITSNEMGASSVTTSSIADGAVTPAKLSPFGPAWSNNLSNFNIQQNSLELSTGITTNSSSFIDFHSVHPLTDYECRIIRYAGTNGGMAIEQTGSGGISIASPNGIFLSNANVPNPIGNAPIYGCRAWGVISLAATRSVDAQANIASATKIDTTHTQIAFPTGTPMPDTSYVVSGCVKNDAALDFSTFDHQTTGFKIRHSTEAAGRAVQFMVIR